MTMHPLNRFLGSALACLGLIMILLTPVIIFVLNGEIAFLVWIPGGLFTLWITYTAWLPLLKQFFNSPVADGSLTRWENWKYFLWWIRPHFTFRSYGYTVFEWGAFAILHERRYYRTNGLFLIYQSLDMEREHEWKIFDYTQPEHKQRKLDAQNNAALERYE